MTETKQRTKWGDFPYRDEAAALRHIEENAVSPEAREKATNFYLGMKRFHDDAEREEREQIRQLASQGTGSVAFKAAAHWRELPFDDDGKVREILETKAVSPEAYARAWKFYEYLKKRRELEEQSDGQPNSPDLDGWLLNGRQPIYIGG